MAEQSLKIADQIVGPPELADWLNLSVQRIEDLAAKNVMVRVARGKYMLKASVQAYCRYASGAASGRAGPDAASRHRLIEAQANMAETKAAVLRGGYVPIFEPARQWTERFRLIKAALLAQSARIAGFLPHLTHDEVAIIDRENRELLEEIARGDYDVPEDPGPGVDRGETSSEAPSTTTPQ